MRAIVVLTSCLLLLAPAPAKAAGQLADPRDAVLQMATKRLADAVIEDVVLEALAARQVDVRGATVRLTGLSATAAVATEAELLVERISWQPTTQRFFATLLAKPAQGDAQRISAIGQLSRDVQVPVPVRPLAPGQIIAASDLELVSFGERRLPANAVKDADEMVGRMPRRPLRQGALVTAADLKRPVLVARGAQVIIVISMQNMRLTARGQALDEGAVGDTVRVVNHQSRAVVSGVVGEDGHVDVTVAGAQPQ
jgi:flagella basal body P-ring formation protein FlgA